MLESNSTTLARVVPWWLQLEQELKAFEDVYLYLKSILARSGVSSKRLNS
jgi:hypothetical protein